MSIKGIDAQIMITRSADVAKVAGSELRRNELNQDYLAVQARTQAEQDKQRVTKTLEAQMATINREKEGSKNPGSSARKAKRHSTEEREEDDHSGSQNLSDGDHIIDIKI